jgi:enamine deaminase RidA (YjgF/YER057c/UK114 family)
MSASETPASYAVHAGGYLFRGGYTAPGEGPLGKRAAELVLELVATSSATTSDQVRKALCWIASEDDRAEVSAELGTVFGEQTALVILCGMLPGGATAGVELVSALEDSDDVGHDVFLATAGLAIDRATTSRLAEAVDLATEMGIVWGIITERVASLGASMGEIVKATAYLDDIAEYAEFVTAYSRLPEAPAAFFVSQIGVTGGCRVQIEVLISKRL